jgi:flagellar assembly factor FliW
MREIQMTIETARFGLIEYQIEDVVTLPAGLIGLPTMCEFLIVQHREGSPFRWLQSLDDPSMAFLVADPTALVASYAPIISDADADALEIDETKPVALLTTVSIPSGQPQEMTLNLAAPIVINLLTRCGKQVVLDEEAYTMRHRVFPEADREDQKLAA